MVEKNKRKISNLERWELVVQKIGIHHNIQRKLRRLTDSVRWSGRSIQRHLRIEKLIKRGHKCIGLSVPGVGIFIPQGNIRLDPLFHILLVAPFIILGNPLAHEL